MSESQKEETPALEHTEASHSYGPELNRLDEAFAKGYRFCDDNSDPLMRFPARYIIAIMPKGSNPALKTVRAVQKVLEAAAPTLLQVIAQVV
jgi:hypothetical protein